VARRSGLGRGLGALIPSDDAELGGEHALAAAAYRELPITAVVPNRWQPRERFDEEGLRELAASIEVLGVLQPVLVRELGDDQFELIAGERRLRAAQMAGLSSIPALVRSVADQSSLEHAVVENLHRTDLNPLEEAAAYQHLIEEFELTQDAVAQRVGKSRSAVTNLLRLFQLPPSVQEQLAEGNLTAGHGRALLALGSHAEQTAMATQAVTEGWSVRELERRVKDGNGAPSTDGGGSSITAARPPTLDVKPPALLELEQLLEDHLETRVTVAMGSSRGRITIDFADLDDLERIYTAMVEGRAE